MYIQPCASKNLIKGATLNFSSQNRSNYSSYMSEKSNDIITISSVGGSLIGLVSAKNDLKRELVPKVFHSIGVVALALFGLASLNFFINEANHSKKKN